MEIWLILGPGQEIYKMSLEHLELPEKEGSTFTLTSTTTTTNKPTMMGMCQKGNMSQIEFLVVKAGTIWAKKLMK